ncbi:MAG: ATP-binding protein [Legionellales bacterium]|nr:ATP-binding protein [Legionellales bacterium]
MRSLYWKIFLSFWLATMLFIISTAWVTNEFTILRLIQALLISGLICYLLTRYLTNPLHSLRDAAMSLARGKLNTRVGHLTGHHLDEIDELSFEFDKMAERLEILIKSNQRLLQDISHELRSPLARLHVAIELGRKKSGTLAKSEFDRMEAECLRLNSLIGETLEFARLDQTNTALSKECVDLPSLIDDIILDANFEVSNQNVSVVFGKRLPCQLFLDKKLIHRTIENVLRNALRYTPSDQKVTISLRHNKAHHHIIIDIEDLGPGVPEPELTEIFKPFYRVDPARAKTTGGYGLGLAIAQEAILAHDGKIYARNRKDGGLLVRMILPEKTHLK